MSKMTRYKSAGSPFNDDGDDDEFSVRTQVGWLLCHTGMRWVT